MLVVVAEVAVAVLVATVALAVDEAFGVLGALLAYW